MKIITISHQPVELYKILKFESLVCGGGEAKMVIANGLVMLNGEIQSQKRKKINSGDIIEFDGEQFQVRLAETINIPAQNRSSSTTEKAVKAEKAVKKVKRSAIRF